MSSERLKTGEYSRFCHAAETCSLFISGTRQVTQAQIVSRFGWGMTKQIENHGLAKFKANIQKVSVNRFVRHNI